MRIGIIGAGHAAVEAARHISDNGGEVVLYSNESFLPYVRPRVVLLAFGRLTIDAMTIRPEPWYRERRIDLRLDCPVTQVDVREKTVTAKGLPERFDALIVATGAAPVLLPFVRELPDDVIPIWAAGGSLTIRRRLETARHLTILGGGISGLEAAVYSRDLGLDATVIEKAPYVMSQQFGPVAAGVLVTRLQEQGVRMITGRFVIHVAKVDGRLRLKLDNGEEIDSDLVLTTVGAVQNVAMFAHAGLRTDRGIVVDEYLRASEPGVYACGDIAQRDHVRTANIVRAAEQGRGAAANAMAALTGHPPEPVAERTIPLSFKHAAIEFHAAGVPAGPDLEERVLPGRENGTYRSVVLEGDILRGVQMIGSREDFRRLADSLGQPHHDMA